MGTVAEDEKRLRELQAKYGMEEEAIAADEGRLTELTQKYGVEPEAAPAPVEEASFADKALHVAKGFGQAGVDVLETPYHLELLANQGLQAMGGEGFETSTKPWTQALLGDENYAGLKQALAGEHVTKEQAPLASSLRTGAEWGAAGPINAIKKGIKDPDVVADLFSAGGAMAGEWIDENLGGEGTWGEIIGGITGLLGGKRKARPPKGESKAYEFIQKNATDPDAAWAKLQEAQARGEEGTLADLTGDRGIFDVEAAAATNPEIAREINDIQGTRQRQIAEEIRKPFGEGDAVAAPEAAKDRTFTRTQAIKDAEATVQADITARTAATAEEIRKPADEAQAVAGQAAQTAQAADEASQAANQVVETPLRSDETSTKIATRLDETEAAFRRDIEQPAWEAYKAQEAFDITAIYDAANKSIKSLDPSIRARLGAKYNDILSRANKWQKDGATPAEVSRYFSDIGDAVDEARDANGRLSKDGKLLNDVYKDMQAALEETNPLFGEARSKTRELHERWRSEGLEQARRGEPERTVDRLGLNKSAGAVTMRKFAENGDPELIPMVTEHLQALAEETAGGVNEAFLRKHQAVLDKLPAEARQQFLDSAQGKVAAADTAKAATAAETAANQAETAAGAQTRSLEQAAAKESADKSKQATRLEGAVNKSIVSEYGRSPQKVVNRLLSNTDNTEELGRLVKYMDDTGNGDAFRAHLGAELKKRLATASDASTAVKPEAIGKFEEMRDILVDSEAITREQAADMSAALNRTRTVTERKTAVAKYLDKQGSEWDNLLASMLAAGGLNLVPGVNSNLLVAGAVRRWIKRLLTSKKTQAAEVEALERMLLNPEAYVDAAKNAKTVDEAARAMITNAVGSGQILEGLAPEEETE